MLKYVSEILNKFTPQQRIIALLLLLLSIILMTTGSDLIKAVKGIPDDVTSVIENQQAQIQLLQGETSRLNSAIIIGNMECTDRIIQREQEIAVHIQEIINVISTKSRVYPMIIKSDTSDTDEKLSSFIPPPTSFPAGEVIYHLEELKNSLQHE